VPNHNDVVRHDFFFERALNLLTAIPISKRDGNGFFRFVLTNDKLV